MKISPIFICLFMVLAPFAAQAEEELAHPGDMERGEYELALKDAIRAAGQRRAEVEEAITQARAAVQGFTVDTELQKRKEQADKLLQLHEEMQKLQEALQAYYAAIDRYLGTPILRLVGLKPAGKPGMHTSYESRLYSVDVNQAPLEIIPGNTARFSVDVIQRRGWKSRGPCTDPQHRPSPDNVRDRLTCRFDVRDDWADWHGAAPLADSYAFTWGKRVFNRYCDQAPTYRKPEIGGIEQVPFEMQEQVQLSVTLQPNKFPDGGGYPFRGEVRSSSRYKAHGLDGSGQLIKSTYADVKGYCTSPGDDRACPDLYVAVGHPGNPVVLHYRHIRTGEQFIASLPGYTHPAEFNKPLEVGEPLKLLAMPDLKGKPLKDVKVWLEDNEMKVTLLPGEPAPSAELSGAVQHQNPAAGVEVGKGATVSLKVHSGHVDERTLPDLAGLTLDKAKRLLSDADLNWKLLPGQPAPTAEDEGKVQQQSPAAGARVASQSYVSLTVYGPYARGVALPLLEGMSYGEAAGKLNMLGLKARRSRTVKPARRDQAGTVQSQSPAVGATAAMGTEVALTMYGEYQPSQGEWVAETDCTQYRGAEAFWDAEAGRPGCRCLSGLRWNLNKTACVSQADYAGEWCAENRPGSRAYRTADGSYECRCPGGYEFADTMTGRKCVRRKPTPQEQVARADCSSRWPGTEAYWDSGRNQARCRCDSGLRWNMDQTACVTQQAFATEYCARKHPGTKAVRKNNGDWDCKCPSGYVYRSASNRCVQQARNQGSGSDCGWMLTQIRGFLDMYRQAPQSNAHLKPIAEGIAQQARNAGCNQGKINQALGSGGGIGSGGTGTGTGSSGGGGGDDGYQCNCVDERGRPYSSAFGLTCEQTAQAWREYNCTPQ